MNTATNEQSTEAVTLTDASDDDLKAMGLPPSFTLDSLKEFLEPEEIAALGEGDDPLLEVPDDEKPAAKGTSAFDSIRGNKVEADTDGEDDEDEDSDTANDDDDSANADDQPDDNDDAKTEDKADDDAGAIDDEPEIPDADKPDPELKRADVSEDEELVATAKEKRQELRKKYSEGELTDEELDEGLEDLTEKIADAKFRIKQAKADEESSHTEYANAWYGKVQGFMEKNPAFADNTPRQELKGHSSLQLFDACLRHVTDPEKSPQFASLTQAQKLAEGVKLAKAEFKRITGQELAQKPAPKVEDEPAPKPKPKKDKATDEPRPKPVQTLADVSSATENEVTDGRFAALDKATGLDAEREFERMTPEQQEAYLRDVS